MSSMRASCVPCADSEDRPYACPTHGAHPGYIVSWMRNAPARNRRGRSGFAGSRSSGGLRRALRRIDAHLVPRLVLVLELHDAIDQREDRVVGAEPDIAAGVILRAALPDDDVPGADGLTAVLLHAAVLRVAVAPVAAGANTLFVRHGSKSAECDVVDLHFREALPVSLLLRVVLAPLHLEHDHLVALAVADDLAGDLRALEHGRPGVDLLAVGAEEHLVEGDLGAHFGFEGRDL